MSNEFIVNDKKKEFIVTYSWHLAPKSSFGGIFMSIFGFQLQAYVLSLKICFLVNLV